MRNVTQCHGMLYYINFVTEIRDAHGSVAPWAVTLDLE